MTKQLTVTVMMLAGLLGITGTSAAEDEIPATHTARVRSTNAAIMTLIAQATEQSPTFRRMVDAIEATDGIVFVQAAPCGHGVQACLKDVKTVGTTRFVRIHVNLRKGDRELMSSIGHELRHAIEILSDRTVRDFLTMDAFYRREGIPSAYGAIETSAATQAGDTVRKELGQFSRRAHGGR